MNEIHGTYHYGLVALSLAIGILTAYVAVEITARIVANCGANRRIWLLGGAVVAGTGMWCMHCIGILAFRLPVSTHYHVLMLAGSLLAAMLASLAAFYVVSRDGARRIQIVVGSLVTGAGIVTMHYLGMGAIRLDAQHLYSTPFWLLSVGAALFFSFIGLQLLVRIRRQEDLAAMKVLVSSFVGLAVPTLQCIGMEALRLVPRAGMDDSRGTISVSISALAICAVIAAPVVLLIATLVTSILDRRITAQQLVRDDERRILRALIDHIPDAMYVKDKQERFLVVNKRFAETAGYADPQLLLGKTYADIYTADHLAKIKTRGKRILSASIDSMDAEEIRLDLQGNEYPVHTTRVALRGGSGDVTGDATVVRDIRDRKRSENALREAERKYRGVLEDALFGIFEVGLDGRLLLANPATAISLGYNTPKELMSELSSSIWPLAARREQLRELKRLVRKNGHVRAFELEVYRKDQTSIWISLSVRARLSSNVLVGYLGVFEDVTERRLLRIQLLQAQKLESVGQLAAGIAHEINTPIQYIGDNIRFLQDSFYDLFNVLAPAQEFVAEAIESGAESACLQRAVDARDAISLEFLSEEVPKAIDQTLDGIARVSALVGAMKEFSHPGKNEKELLDLNHAIENSVTVARNEWKYVADVKLELEPELPGVYCLPGEIVQVVLNLVINAAHAIADAKGKNSTEKGMITIRTRQLVSTVEIQIEDTGTGIPQNIQNRIFDPFFTTKEIGKGTGQGLAIARSVVMDKHQGTITFETRDGHGTTFFIQLPRNLNATAELEAA